MDTKRVRESESERERGGGGKGGREGGRINGKLMQEYHTISFTTSIVSYATTGIVIQ